MCLPSTSQVPGSGHMYTTLLCHSKVKKTCLAFPAELYQPKFYILLTVHLGKWPNWRTILFYVLISILYMFRPTSCLSSGESIVSIQHLVYVTLYRWPFRVQVGKELSYLHTKRSPIQCDIYQMLYWYNWFSGRWAQGCSKHVENWNKHIEKKMYQLDANNFTMIFSHKWPLHVSDIYMSIFRSSYI